MNYHIIGIKSDFFFFLHIIYKLKKKISFILNPILGVILNQT